MQSLMQEDAFSLRFVTNFSRRRYERVAPDAMSRSFGAAQIIWRLEAGNAPRIDGRLAGEDSRYNEVLVAGFATEQGHRLAGKGHESRLTGHVQNRLPALGGLDRIARATEPTGVVTGA
jgi:hypothetical protein